MIISPVIFGVFIRSYASMLRQAQHERAEAPLVLPVRHSLGVGGSPAEGSARTGNTHGVRWVLLNSKIEIRRFAVCVLNPLVLPARRSPGEGWEPVEGHERTV